MSRHNYHHNFRSRYHNGVEYPAEYTHSNVALPFDRHFSSMGAPSVEATARIVKYLGTFPSPHGDHQHFLIHIAQVLEVLGAPISLVHLADVNGANCYVAARYGSLTEHAQPIPGLAAGVDIRIRGEYVDNGAASFHSTSDNPNLSVLHFTHNPRGFITVGGHEYE